MDKLWDICEVRKKETAKERKNILDNNWLLDKMGVVTNHYISLMNCELVKFQEAVLLLKDYYASMQRGKEQYTCTCTCRALMTFSKLKSNIQLLTLLNILVHFHVIAHLLLVKNVAKYNVYMYM